MKVLFVALFLCLNISRAEARVFDINSEKFASYFLVTDGPSAIKKNAFLNEVNTTNTFSSEAAYNYTGEFGFLYSTPVISLRFGFEVFKPSVLKGVVANDGSADIYTLDSNITVYAPKLGLEINLQKTPTYRSFITAYGGLGNASYKNQYTIMSYPGVADHAVETKGTGMLYGASLGVESYMTDTTTYIFEFGYRLMKITNFKYSKDVTTFSGAKTAGDPVLDADGLPRILDFSGGYISLGFRFYM
ncbi:MAG: hypothetical protein ACXWRA_04800 [Pseudobdellovibrionaceae bacterium]